MRMHRKKKGPILYIMSRANQIATSDKITWFITVTHKFYDFSSDLIETTNYQKSMR